MRTIGFKLKKYWLLSALILMNSFLNSCGFLDYFKFSTTRSSSPSFGEAFRDGMAGFEGIKSLQENADGTYTLTWTEAPPTAKFQGFNIYSRPEVSTETEKAEYNYAAPFATVGVVASFTTPSLRYKASTCFAVRTLGAAYEDTNVAEICTKHKKLEFLGLKTLTFNENGSWTLGWDFLPQKYTYITYVYERVGDNNFNFDTYVSLVNSHENAFTTGNQALRGKVCFAIRHVSSEKIFVDENIVEKCIDSDKYKYSGITSFTKNSDDTWQIGWENYAQNDIKYNLYVRANEGKYSFAAPLAEFSNPVNTYKTTSYNDGLARCFVMRATYPGAKDVLDTNSKEVCTGQVPMGDFPGCANYTIRDSTSINIEIKWPDTASGMEIFRDNNLIFSSNNKAEQSFTDTGLDNSVTYKYTCKAIIDNISYLGKTRFNLRPANEEVDTSFKGCSEAVNAGKNMVKITYAWPTGANGKPAENINVYRNGLVVNSDKNTKNNSYIDTVQTEGLSYLYDCNAVVAGKEMQGPVSVANVAPLPVSATPIPTVLVTLSPTPSPTPVVSASPTPVITASPSPTPVITASPSPTPTPVPTLAPPPNPVGQLAIPDSSAQVSVSWSSGGGTTSDYRISYQAGATAPITCAVGTTISETLISGTSHPVTGLNPNTEYSFRVCAINSNPTPDVSAGITATATSLLAPPPNPTGQSATANSTSQITVAWTSGGGTTTDYRIAYKLGATAPVSCAVDTTISDALIAGTSHPITGLAAGTQYSFRVCAINANPTPDVSAGVTATATTLVVPPLDPTGPSATANSTSQITLNWTSGGGTTADYKIAYKLGATAPTDCASDTTISDALIGGTSHPITGLAAATQYSFRVCAINGNPTPDVSAGVTATATTLLVAPLDPTGPSATVNSDTQITLNWTSGGGTTADYRIAYKLGATAPATCALDTTISEAAITGTSHPVTGLTAATQYSFRVCAINANPTPDVSAGVTVTATTLQAAPPNPTGPTATVNSTTQITLDWVSGAGSTADYRISYQTGGSAPATCAAGTTISEAAITGVTHPVSGLSPGTQYSFRICAINSNGTPDVSAGVTAIASTLQAAPPNPTGVTYTYASATTATLSWTSGGGSTADYRISYDTGATPPASCAAGTQIGEGAITGTSNTISDLVNLTEYSFRVCAINSNGTPDVSAGAVLTVTHQLTDYTSANIGTLKYVPAGTFQYSAAGGDLATISAPFRMSQYEITMEQYTAVTVSANPSASFTGVANAPVQYTNWYHAIYFCNKLSVLEGLTPVYTVNGSTDPTTWGAVPTISDATWNAATANWGANGYRLPTEMEWMWAAMGANYANSSTGYTKAFAGDNLAGNLIGDFAWYSVNGGSTTHTKGTKSANELGLYDMSGNVWEWVWDWYAAYPGGALSDFKGAAPGTVRVARGGGWNDGATFATVAYRNNGNPFGRYNNLGFRVARL